MKWDADSKGDVIWYPVKGFQVAPAAETMVMVRVECSPTPEQSAQKLDAAQFGMAPKQALQLAEDLRKAAEHILNLPRQGKLN